MSRTYNYFKDSEFDLKTGKVLSSFIVIVDSEIEYRNNYTRFGCDISIWFQDNGGISDVSYILHHADWVFIFKDEKKAIKFNKWLKKYAYQEFSSKYELWRTYDDFKTEINDSGNIMVSDSIEYSLRDYLSSYGNDRYLGEITNELFELYKWMTKNLKGKIWHWKGHFRFELEEDAVTFKLYNTPKETDDA